MALNPEMFGGRTRYLIIRFKKFMQDHLINSRPEAQIPSGQILTDGLELERRWSNND